MSDFAFPLIGHQSITQSLLGDFENGRHVHAYLFHGPAHSGKSTLMKHCADQLSEGEYDRIHLVESSDSIKIAEVRQLNSQVSLSASGSQRIVQIEAIERMPIEAQNAFLKTLEEPSSNTIFFLSTHQLSLVLPTVQSRCRLISVSPLSASEMSSFLAEQVIPENEQTLMQTYAMGRIGKIITWLQNPEEWKAYQNEIERIEHMLETNELDQKLMQMEALEKEPEQLEHWMDAFYGALQKRWRQKSPSRWKANELTNLFDVLEKTRYYLKGNVNKRLALGELMIATEK